MSGPGTAICWFRQDLRLEDNPALAKAASHKDFIVIYIDDDIEAGDRAKGGASKVGLYHSLFTLNKKLDGRMNFYQGRASKIVAKLCETFTVSHIYWNRCYEPWRIKRDTKLKKILQTKNIEVQSFNASLLWEPWEVCKSDGSPYRVFSPFFFKGCRQAASPRRPLPRPDLSSAKLLRDGNAKSLDNLGLLSGHAREEKIADPGNFGEEAVKKGWKKFQAGGLKGYKQGRDFPAKKNVSQLSAALHFGHISPNRLWYDVQTSQPDADGECFCKELGWREFSYHLLFHFPYIGKKNLQEKFDAYPWATDHSNLLAWKKGLTGIPIIDAGMRQLWQTGYMHNRVRMITASFLVKNMGVDWRIGENWFWDCLMDADMANNSASWQWVAGSGADAAPFFRIFNPITQAKKFDPDGTYIRKYIPELAGLPNPHLFDPANAPTEALTRAKIQIGKDYPTPILDLKTSREKALSQFKQLASQ